jgi:hypothetical protein
MKKLRFSGRAAIICSLILAIGVPSVAMGFGEGRNLLLGKRNPSANPALALTSETEIIANSATYGTRQSNKKDGDGGGAIYGCRSSLGNEPCIRSANLKGGHSFEFSTVGAEGGRITTGSATGAPFTTNATGVATGLNADRVDGKDATDFASAADVTALAGSLLFAAVTDPGNGDSTLVATGRSGATPTSVPTATESGDTYTVTFAKDVSKCSFTATPVGNTPTAPQSLAVASGTSATQVTVTSGTPGSDPSFHLQVIC